MAEISAEKGESLNCIFQRVSVRTGLDVEVIKNAVYDEGEDV